MAGFKRLMGEISKARETGDFTDFVLVCGPERFPVHKVIVCSQSKVLHAACSKPFREAASGEYEFVEQSPAIVRRMVDYFYNGDYRECSKSTQDPSKEKPECSDDAGLTPLCIHAKMFALADMYQVDQLRSLAVTKYANTVEKGANIQDLLESIPDVYQLTPSPVRALRDKAVMALRVKLGRTVRFRQPAVANPDGSGDHSGQVFDTLMTAYDEVATESPEFLKDLLSSYIHAPLLGRCYNCGPVQPTEPLQMKCLNCSKGGATSL